MEQAQQSRAALVVVDADLPDDAAVRIQPVNAPAERLPLLLEAAQGAPVTVIAVTTAEAQPAFTRLSRVLAAFAAERSIPPPLLTRADITGHSLADAVQRIVRQIPPRAEVYIDTTGSFRNASYILLAVVRILEYSGIHCVKAVYSNYHASPRRIEDVTNAYRLFDLINAANSFTAFGNSTELERFFREKDNPRIRRVVAAMKDFSKTVAMCRTSGLDGILAEMNESLSEIDAMEPRTEEEVLFCSISGLIRQKFGIPSPGGKIEYPEIIRRCLSNQMIQQAVTIYIEKAPAYLLEKRYFTVSEAIRAHAEANRGVYDFAYHALRRFSLKTDRLFVQEPLRAIEECLHRKNREDQEKIREKKIHRHSFRKVIGGGDEITLICRAEDAADIVTAYFASARHRTRAMAPCAASRRRITASGAPCSSHRRHSRQRISRRSRRSLNGISISTKSGSGRCGLHRRTKRASKRKHGMPHSSAE